MIGDLELARPSNRFLVQERDRRWGRSIALALSLSVVTVVVLVLIGWPRLESVAVHYDLIRLRAEVEALEERHRELSLRLEAHRSPETLAAAAAEAGLVAVDPASTGALGSTPPTGPGPGTGGR